MKAVRESPLADTLLFRRQTPQKLFCRVPAPFCPSRFSVSVSVSSVEPLSMQTWLH